MDSEEEPTQQEYARHFDEESISSLDKFERNSQIFQTQLSLGDMPETLKSLIHEEIFALEGKFQHLNEEYLELVNKTSQETGENFNKIGKDIAKLEENMQELQKEFAKIENEIANIPKNPQINQGTEPGAENESLIHKEKLLEEIQKKLNPFDNQLKTLEKKLISLENSSKDSATALKKESLENHQKNQKEIKKTNDLIDTKTSSLQQSFEELMKDYKGSISKLSDVFEQKNQSSMSKLKAKVYQLTFENVRLKEKVNKLQRNMNLSFFKLKTDSLDSDTFFYTSALLYYGILFIIGLIILLFFIIILIPLLNLISLIKRRELEVDFTKTFNILLMFFKMILCIMSFLFLAIPGFFVIFTQTICILELNSYMESESLVEDSVGMSYLKGFIEIFFFFMISSEISCAINSSCFIFFNEFAKEDNENLNCFRKLLTIFHCTLQIIPQMVQIFYAFWIAYINMLLLATVETPVDLIQNFAGLLILLEFDNYVLLFFRNLGIFHYFDRFLELIDSKYAEENRKRREAKEERIRKEKEENEKIKEEKKKINEKMEKQRSPAHRPTENKSKIKDPPAPPKELTNKIRKDNEEKQKKKPFSLTDLLNKIESEGGVYIITSMARDQNFKRLLTKSSIPLNKKMKENFESKEMMINIVKLVVMVLGIGMVLLLSSEFYA